MKNSIVIGTIIIFFFSLFALPLSSFSHSGRTNKRGGHYNRKTGSYHVHSGGSNSTARRSNSSTRGRKYNRGGSFKRSTGRGGGGSLGYFTEDYSYTNDLEQDDSYEQFSNYRNRPSYGGDNYSGPSYYGRPNIDEQSTNEQFRQNLTRESTLSYLNRRKVYNGYGSYTLGTLGTSPRRVGQTSTGYENGAYHTPSPTLHVIPASSADGGVFADRPAVIDGDTVRLSTIKGDIKLRLYGIDAPEITQVGGMAGKEFLHNLIAGKSLYVVPYGKDKYGRTVGVLYADGVNVNEQLLASGHAWFADRSCRKSFCSGWQALSNRAHGQRRGLWVNRNSEAPWNWRARQQP